MFFVRGAKRPQEIYQAIQPFTKAIFIVDIVRMAAFARARKLNKKGFAADIFSNAYATYIGALSDAAVEDRIPYPLCIDFLILVFIN